MSELSGRDHEPASEPKITLEQQAPPEEPASQEVDPQMKPPTAVPEPEAPELTQLAAPEVAPEPGQAEVPVPAQEATKSKKGKAKKAKSAKGKAKKAKKKGKKGKKK